MPLNWLRARCALYEAKRRGKTARHLRPYSSCMEWQKTTLISAIAQLSTKCGLVSPRLTQAGPVVHKCNYNVYPECDRLIVRSRTGNVVWPYLPTKSNHDCGTCVYGRPGCWFSRYTCCRFCRWPPSSNWENVWAVYWKPGLNPGRVSLIAILPPASPR